MEQVEILTGLPPGYHGSVSRGLSRRKLLRLALFGPAVAGVSCAAIVANAHKASANSVIDVESFRDGVRTDNELLAAAFDAASAGGEVRFGQSVTYTLTTAFAPDLTDKPGLVINGRGATIYAPSTVGVIFSPQGTKFPVESQPKLTAAVTTQTRTLKVSDTSRMQPGDLVQILSDELFDEETNTGGEKRQEMARIESIPDANTIVLQAPTWNTYSTNGYSVELAHYRPVRDLTVNDLTVASDRANVNCVGLQTAYFDGLTYSNVRAYGCPGYGIDAYGGFNLVAVGCRATECTLENWKNLPEGKGPNGYGFHTAAVHGAAWINCFGATNRHSFDAHKTRDLLIQGCTVENDQSSGISTHGVDTAKIVNNTVRNSGGGIIIRGTNNTITGNSVLGVKIGEESAYQSYVNGIWVGIYGGQQGAGGYCGTNLVIDNNYIDVSGPKFLAAHTSPDGIRVDSPAINAKITNNTIKGFSQRGIALRGNGNSGVTISQNRIDCSGQQDIVDGPRNRPAIYVKPVGTSSSFVSTDIQIDDNTVFSWDPNVGIVVAGGSTKKPVSNDIRIGRNTVSVISLDDGYYGPRIKVDGNRTQIGEPSVVRLEP
jgi:parallel beta-helix repeat protein